MASRRAEPSSFTRSTEPSGPEFTPPERLRSRSLWPWLAALLTFDAATQATRLVVQLTLLGHGETTGTLESFNAIIGSHNQHLLVDQLMHTVTWVVTLFWAHRMWSDVAALRPSDRLAFTPRAAVRGFFVPFYNIVHPWRMFSALREATLPAHFPVPEVVNPRAGYRDAPTVQVLATTSTRLMLGAWYTCTTLASLVLPILDRRHEKPIEHLAPEQALGLAGVLLTLVFTRGLQAQLTEQHRRSVAHHRDEFPPAPRPLRVALLVALPVALGISWLVRPLTAAGIAPSSLVPVGAVVALPLLAACALGLRWLARRHPDLVPRFGLVVAASFALLVGTAASTRHAFTLMDDVNTTAQSLFASIDRDGDELRDSDTPREDLLARITASQARLEQLADTIHNPTTESFRCNGRDLVDLGRAHLALGQSLQQAREATTTDISTLAGLARRSRSQQSQHAAYQALAAHFSTREQLQRCLRDGHAEPQKDSDKEVTARHNLVLLYTAQADLAARYQAVHELQMDDLLSGTLTLGARRREALHRMALAQVDVANAERAFAPPQPAPERPSLDEDYRDFTTSIHLEPMAAPPPPKGLERTAFRGPLGRMTAYTSPRRKEMLPAVLWLLDGNDPEGSLREASALAEHRVVVMVPLVRGWQPSPGQRELMLGEIDDLVAARNHLAARGDVDADRIVVVGKGLGGSEAMLLASRVTNLRAVVAVHPLLDADDLEEQLPAMTGREAELRSPSRYAGRIQPDTWMLLDDGDLLAGDTIAARFNIQDGATSHGPLFALSYTGEPLQLAPRGPADVVELAAKLATMKGEPSPQGLRDDSPAR